MARRRRYLTRPHDHLVAAAAVHARAAAGEPPEGGEAETDQAETEPSTSQLTARRQPRDQGGKFK